MKIGVRDLVATLLYAGVLTLVIVFNGRFPAVL